jgi:hypothetical protein
MSQPDFPHVTLVRSWLEQLATLHPEEREYVDDVAAQVGTRSTMTLHYGALGLRVRVERARDAGECSAAFQARADVVLWGLEVLAVESKTSGLPREVVSVVVETSLACADAEIPFIARAVDAAERVRWREVTDARARLDGWAAMQPSLRWTAVADALRAYSAMMPESAAIPRADSRVEVVEEPSGPLTFYEQGTPLGDADLDAFEARVATTLPDEYRRFLKLHNGGRVRPRSVRIEDGPSCTASIQDFLSLTSLEKTWATFKEEPYARMPPEHIPIAICEGGDYLTLVAGGPMRGQILLWFHEEEGDETYTYDNLYFVASSLDELIAGST